MGIQKNDTAIIDGERHLVTKVPVDFVVERIKTADGISAVDLKKVAEEAIAKGEEVFFGTRQGPELGHSEREELLVVPVSGRGAWVSNSDAAWGELNGDVLQVDDGPALRVFGLGIAHDRQEEGRRTTLEPITVSGWYEHTDGTVGQYTWRNGRVEHDATVASWAAVPSPFTRAGWEA